MVGLGALGMVACVVISCRFLRQPRAGQGYRLPEVGGVGKVAGDGTGTGFFARGPGAAAQAQDQVVAGPGGRDVHEADVLRGGHHVFPVLQVLEPLGAEAVSFRPKTHFDTAVGAVKEGWLTPAVTLGVDAGQHHHRELQALGRMDGHHPHRLLVRLGHRRLGDPGALRHLVLHPSDESAQWAAARGCELPGPLHHEPVPAPLLPHPRMSRCRLHQPPVPHEAVYEVSGGLPDTVLVKAPQYRQGFRHRPGRAIRLVCQAVEPSSCLVVAKQFHVAASESHRPQRRHGGNLVRRVVDGLETVEQVPDLLGFEDQRCALHPVGNITAFHRAFQRGQRGAGRHQHANIGVNGPAVNFTAGLFAGAPVQDLPALGHDLPQQRRDVRGFRPADAIHRPRHGFVPQGPDPGAGRVVRTGLPTGSHYLIVRLDIAVPGPLLGHPS